MRSTITRIAGGFISAASTLVIWWAQEAKVITSQNVHYILIGFIILFSCGVGLFIWSFFLPKNNRVVSDKTTDTLQTLLVELDKQTDKLKDKASKRFVTWKELEKAISLINDAFGINQKDINIHREKAKREIEKQKEQNIYSPRSITNVIFAKYTETIGHDSTSAERIANILDSVNLGLADIREHNKTWNTVYNNIRQIELKYNDRELSKLIKDYIGCSFEYNSIFLLDKYISKFVPDVFMPTKYMESGIRSPRMIKNETMNKLYNKVLNRLKELQNQRKNEL